MFIIFFVFQCLFTECTHLLLAHGAPVKVKNLEGWSPLAEAISFGDRQTSTFPNISGYIPFCSYLYIKIKLFPIEWTIIKFPIWFSAFFYSFTLSVSFSRPHFCQTVSSLLQKLKQQAKEQMETRRPNLVKALKQMGDFYMELKWDFQSWGKFFVFNFNLYF